MARDTRFDAVPRRSVADAVHEQLRARVLDGTLAPGSALPGERALCEQFGVNRHALREALKRLAQVGLVEVAHGGRTRVRDWRSSAGLDVLADVAVDDPGTLAGALRMRRAIGVDVVRLAAGHRADVALQPADPDGYERFWSALVDASQTLAYRLALNSLEQAIHRMREAFAELSRAEWQDGAAHAALAAAVRDGDVERAASLADDLLRRTMEAARG